MINRYRVPHFILSESHLSDGVFMGDLMPMDLFNELSIEVLHQPKIQIDKRSGFKIHTNDQNPIYQALKLLQSKKPSRSGAQVAIDQKSPVNSGLLSEWACAAACLILLNQKWDFNLSNSELGDLAQSLHPYCYVALEQFLLDPPLLSYKIFLIQLKNITINTDWLKGHLVAENVEETLLYYFPDFEFVFKKLRQMGSLKVGFSGIGPMIFAQFESNVDDDPLSNLLLESTLFTYWGQTCLSRVELVD